MSRPAPRCWDLPISSKLLGPPLGTEIRLEMWRKARDAVEGHAGGPMFKEAWEGSRMEQN
jgi:hypothetical protein